MSPSGRINFIADIFKTGLPEDLAAMLGLTEQSWTLINVPTASLAAQSSDHDLPKFIDAIAGPLVAKHEPDLAEVQRRARWHYGLPGQDAARRRMATDLALSRGLLVPEVKHAAAVQFRLGCLDSQINTLGQALTRMGFDQAIVLVGAGGDVQPAGGTTIVQTQVEEQEDGLVLRVEGGHGEAQPRRTPRPSKHLRAGLHRIFQAIELPRCLPCVVDMAESWPRARRNAVRGEEE